MTMSIRKHSLILLAAGVAAASVLAAATPAAAQLLSEFRCGSGGLPKRHVCSNGEVISELLLYLDQGGAIVMGARGTCRNLKTGKQRYLRNTTDLAQPRARAGYVFMDFLNIGS